MDMKIRFLGLLSALFFVGLGCRHYVVRDAEPIRTRAINNDRIALVGFKCYEAESYGNTVVWRVDPACDLKSEMGFGRDISDIRVDGFDTEIDENALLGFIEWAEVKGEPRFSGEAPSYLPEKDKLFGRDDTGRWRFLKRDVDYYVVGKLTPYRTAFTEAGAVAYFSSLIPHIFTAGIIPIMESTEVQIEVGVFDRRLNRVETKKKRDTYWTVTSWFARPNGRRGAADNGIGGSRQLATPPSNAWVPSVVEISNELVDMFPGGPVE